MSQLVPVHDAAFACPVCGAEASDAHLGDDSVIRRRCMGIDRSGARCGAGVVQLDEQTEVVFIAQPVLSA